MRKILDALASGDAQVYVVGESAHQVVGQYEEAGRTVVKVRFRATEGAAWVEWDLPCRHIDGVWRMSTEALAAMFGDRAPQPQSVPRPAVPTMGRAELEAWGAASRFGAQGGDRLPAGDEAEIGIGCGALRVPWAPGSPHAGWYHSRRGGIGRRNGITPRARRELLGRTRARDGGPGPG